MEKQTGKTGQETRVPQLAASSKFNRYKKEGKKRTLKADVLDDEILKKLETACRDSHRFLEEMDEFEGNNPTCIAASTMIAICYPAIHDIDYSFRSVERFAIAMKQCPELECFLGNFISALICLKNCERLDIQLSHHDFITDNIGTCNRQILLVRGNVGDMLGRDMLDGMIILDGNAGVRAGDHLKGGAIIINGNAGENVAENMSGGLIIVEQDVGESSGFMMDAGILLVRGNAGDEAGYALSDTGNLIILGNTADNAGKRMHGGYLNIRGKTGDFAGLEMDSGVIQIDGDAGEGLGEGMSGGEIHVNGEIGSIGRVIHGSIYHETEQIVHKK